MNHDVLLITKLGEQLITSEEPFPDLIKTENGSTYERDQEYFEIIVHDERGIVRHAKPYRLSNKSTSVYAKYEPVKMARWATQRLDFWTKRRLG
jgi:hypothetical protein